MQSFRKLCKYSKNIRFAARKKVFLVKKAIFLCSSDRLLALLNCSEKAIKNEFIHCLKVTKQNY